MYDSDEVPVWGIYDDFDQEWLMAQSPAENACRPWYTPWQEAIQAPADEARCFWMDGGWDESMWTSVS
jgi:hypothetical protein